MGRSLSRINYYLRIYRLFAKYSIMSNLEYRANFIMAFLVECAYVLFKSLYIIVAYQTDLHINGVTPDAVLFFVGTYTLNTGFMNAFFFPNFNKISGYVNDGSFDVLMTKPISLQFLATLRYMDFGLATPNIIAGLAMIFVAFKRLNIELNLYNVGGYTVLIICSIVLTYSVLLFPSLLSFWLVKTQAISDITYSFWDFNNMPMLIYNRFIRVMGTYVIPIFVISSFPCMLVLRKLNMFEVIWALIIPVIMLFLVRAFWNIAIKKYNSASS